MRRSLRTFVALSLLSFSMPALAGETVSEREKNSHLGLCELRLNHAKVRVERKILLRGWAKSRVDRLTRLQQSGAASIEEYEDAVHVLNGAETRLIEARARVIEAEGLNELCKARLAEGKDFPILTLDSLDD